MSKRRQRRDFAKDLASMANTPREGDAHIVLGVKKHLDGTFTLLGINMSIDDADMQGVATSHLEPVPRFNYQPIQYCGVLLGLISIPPDQQYPVSPRATKDDGFVEGSIYFRRGSQNATASVLEQKRIWDWFRGETTSADFNKLIHEEALSQRQRLDTDALLHGPVQVLGLTRDVEEAQRIVDTCPTEAARLYAEIAQGLRGQFPGYAHSFEQLRAAALKAAGNSDASHDLLMELAIHDLFEQAEPQLSANVEHGLGGLRNEVDEVRKARGDALTHFGRCHEYSGELEKLAECFDKLESVDEFAPFIAALLAEAALADRAAQIVVDRYESLRDVDTHGNTPIGIRIRAALGDASVPGIWPDLINEAESHRFSAAERTYVYLRGARWCAWNGQLDRAKVLCRLAMKFGSEEGLDLDVENALWSLTVLHSLGDPSVERFEELSETNRMALSMKGSRSFVMSHSRTQQRSYQYLANGQLPVAHLWTQYRLLESIRSGCLMDELESHAILARIYDQSDEPLNALEHAILGGSQQLVKDMTQKVSEWPNFLTDMLISKAPWVLRTALLALKYVGDLAPPKVARGLVSELLCQLRKDPDDVQTVLTLLEALGSIILEAPDEDIERLIPFLKRASVRKHETYRLTDPGVIVLATRLYRFRPKFRKQAACILGEMAVGSHTGEWFRALDECGDETGELVEALERVAERKTHDLTGPLSELGHVTEATRALWASRLQFVADHPLGKRSGGAIGPRYDVPSEFLRQHDSTVSLQYVKKLVAIGSDDNQFVLNRAAALMAAANVVDVLSPTDRGHLFKHVRPLAEQPIQISEMDEYHASTQHPLSRFRMSFGSATDVRTSAGWFLGRAAMGRDECSVVTEIAVDWVRSDDSALQNTGASILALSNVSSCGSHSAELAKHENPSVRRAAVRMLNMEVYQETVAFEQLAADPDRRVRIAVAQAPRTAELMDPNSYKRIRESLKTDQSGIVRACASELWMS